MTAGGQVAEQFMGVGGKGWMELRPHPMPDGSVWSVFKGRVLNPDEGVTIVESLAQLIHEATFRILPYRKGEKKTFPETVLGHAAAAHGTALDIAEMQWDIKQAFTQIQADIAEIKGKV